MGYKVLGQVKPVANTDTTLYTTPGGLTAVVSTLTICNQAATGIATFRVAVRPAGAAIAGLHYVIYDVEVAPEDSSFLTIGITLNATDVVTVRASTANVSFSLFGQEL